MAGSDLIEIYKGEDVVLPFTMDPVADVTGWTVVLTVKGEGFTISKTATVTDGPGGEFEFTLTDDDTDLLPTGQYRYDVWRTDAGAERVIAIGFFVVHMALRDVTL